MLTPTLAGLDIALAGLWSLLGAFSFDSDSFLFFSFHRKKNNQGTIFFKKMFFKNFDINKRCKNKIQNNNKNMQSFQKYSLPQNRFYEPRSAWRNPPAWKLTLRFSLFNHCGDFYDFFFKNLF